MKVKLLFVSLCSFIFIILSNFNYVFADSIIDKSNEYNGLGYAKAIMKEGIEPPYSVNKSVNEVIDPATGTINLKQTDINLKGRNGLDFSLTRYYSQQNSTLLNPYVSSSANYSLGYSFLGYCVDVTVEIHKCVNGIVLSTSETTTTTGFYSSYEAAQSVTDYFNSLPYEYGEEYYDPQHHTYVYDVTEYEADSPYSVYQQYEYVSSYSYYNNLSNSTSNDKYSDLGAGWSFDLPYIENITGYLYLNYGSAGSWQIDFGSSGGQSHLKDYPLIDMKLNNDSQTYYNGQAYSYYVLEQKEGKKIYFGSDGRLLGIKDRFNNEIRFQHDTSRNGYPLVNKIIDSVGREINISYTASEVIVTINDLTDSLNNRTITYNKALISGYSNEYVLDNVVDTANRQTKYQYDIKSGNVNLLNKAISSGVTNKYACLTKIISPSTAELIYNYEKIIKNCGTDGVMESYKLSERYDSKNDGLKYNYKKLNYLYGNTGEFDGYPNYTSEQNIPDSYLFKTQILDDLSNSEVYTYNKKLLPTDILSEGTDHKTQTINEYDATTRLMLKTIFKVFNKATGSSMQTVENYQYDSLGYRDLIGYWDYQASRNSSNIPIDNEHKVTYTYESTYHYPLTKTYKLNESTTITEESIPTSDKKSIEWSNILQNGTLKSKTWNKYDSYGNVTEERNYLDGWIEFISTFYGYSDNKGRTAFNGAYLTRKWVTGVKNADGSLVASRTSIAAGEIDEIYQYDWYGNIEKKQDSNGNTVSYKYDKLNRVIRETNDSDGSYKEWVYKSDATENSVIITNENYNSTQYKPYGNKTKFLYDGLGNLVEQQLFVKNLSNGLEQLVTTNQYEYDINSRLDWEKSYKKIGSTDHTYTDYKYFNDGRLDVKEIKDVQGSSSEVIYQESYKYDDAFSSELSKITKTITGEPNSPAIITNTYVNNLGLVKKQGRMHNGLEYIDTFEYDYLGNKISEKTARAYDEPQIYPSCSYTTKYDYDFAGNVIKTTNVDGTFSTSEYDSLGRLKRVADFKSNLTNPAAYWTTFEYDNLGRLIKETIPFEKDGTGTIRYTVKKHYYDRNGNIVSEMVSNNKPGETLAFTKTDYEYNNRGMLSKVTTYDNGNPENYTQYYYDAAGNKVRMYTGLDSPLNITGLDTVAPSGDSEYSVTKYEYDSNNRLVKMIDPMEQTEDYIYELNGNIIQKNDRNDSTITMTYDGLGRLLTNTVTNENNPSLNASYSYTYTLTGNRETMSGEGTSTSYYYDDLGRLFKETVSNGSQKEYDYDASNNRKLLIIKQNGVVKTNTSYEYDNMNRLQYVKENGSLIATYSYDKNGNREKLNYSNGNITDYTYNIANKVKTLTNKKGTTILSGYDYEYTLDGNQVKKTENTGKATNYIYDGLGRLKSEAVSGETAISYEYDDSNNRETKTVGTEVTSYNYDKNNRLTTETKVDGSTTYITRYTYDNNGNQIFKATEIIKPILAGEKEGIELTVAGESLDNSNITLNEYNGFNQLIKTTTGDTIATYTYNADGLRTGKTVNGVTTTHIWDGDQIALELNGSGTVTNKYVRGINLLYAENTAGTKQYYLFNGHGDVVQLTNSTTGDVVKTYDYDAFGNEKNLDPNDANVFRYCGEYFDKETGVIYLRARYYDPTIGRFISEDSVWGKDNDPLSLNLYTYCYNNPIIYTDPSGHYVSDWDYAHCTSGEIESLELYSRKYVVAKAANDTISMAEWHSKSEEIRNKHRASWEIGTGDGNTKYKTFNATSISAVPSVDVISFKATFGTGLEAKFKVAGVGVEVGGKRYYDLSNVASNNATESLEFSFMAQASNKVQIGGKFTGTVDAYTREHLKNEGFAGIKIGDTTYGWNNLPYNTDFSLEFSVGGYLGVGGEGAATINVSELWRRITYYFDN